eukprot:GGOE01004908.1.p1 GENE.GGOE01004908.1~~GGOE01004908.1.p1  ORF type:complete len:164 (-),score=19.55 GGOE01004908.1:344-775(-)
MAEPFETHERKFCDLFQAITCDVNDLQKGPSPQKTRALEAKLTTLEDSLHSMEAILARMPSETQAQLSKRVHRCQADARDLRKTVDQAKAAASRADRHSCAVHADGSAYRRTPTACVSRLKSQMMLAAWWLRWKPSERIRHCA